MILTVLSACTGGDPDAGSSLLAVLAGDDKLTTTRGQAIDSGLLIDGTKAQGQGWAVAVAEGLLIVGLPELDEVHVLDASDLGRVRIEDITIGHLVGPRESRFGASISHGPRGLLVGGPDTDAGTTSPDAGAAWLFAELPVGEVAASSAELILHGEAAFDHLGEVVALCEDTLGLAAPWQQSGALLGGAVYLVEEETGELPVAAVGTRWASATEGAQLGRALGCREGEVLAGAPFEDGDHEAVGAVFELPASPGGSIEGAGTLSLFGLLGQDYAGSSIATGDIDADGDIDVAIGAFGSDATLLFDGSQLAIGSRSPQYLFPGGAVSIGDLNGDGHDDLVTHGDSVNVYRGGVGFNDWPRIQEEPDASFEQAASVVVGDIDLDGADDLLVLIER